MLQQIKLNLVIILLIVSLDGLAQRTGFRGVSIMPGITGNPFAMLKNYATGTTYSLQFGEYGFPLKGVVRFGLPHDNKDLSGIHTVNYSISGNYIEPGLMLYSNDISEVNNVFYVGLLGYLGNYKHTLTLEIEDSWGVQKFEYQTETKVKGLLLEMGGLFTIYEGIKGTISVNFGGVKRPPNPIPQVQNFTNKTSLIPGIGHGIGGLFWGLNFGLHYEIF